MFARYLVIGNGVAGINAARVLSQASSEGEVVVFSAEPYHYYNRWQLPALVAGTQSLEKVYFYPEHWYAENNIQVHLGTQVDAISPEEHQVTLADGRQIGYGSLLIASGGYAFIPALSGVDKRGVFVLRTLNDALAIRDYARKAHQAIVVGGGLLGLEAAYSVNRLGLRTTVVEYAPRLLPRQLDAPGSAIFQDLIEGRGLEVVTGAATTQILGDGQSSGIQLEDGRSLEGDLIVISAGMRSNVGIAQRAGLKVGRGIAIDQWMATSAPDVYAAGDCAEFQEHVYGIIPAAIEQARVAALRMLGAETTPYGGTISSTTLKVAGIDLTCIGEANAQDGCTLIRYENREQGRYRKLVLRDGKLVGAILLGSKADVAPVTRLIKAQVDVSAYESKLADADFNFRAILAAPARPKAPRFECTICGYIYDPEKGNPEVSLPPNTPFVELPEEWVCPSCGATPDLFTRLAD